MTQQVDLSLPWAGLAHPYTGSAAQVQKGGSCKQSSYMSKNQLYFKESTKIHILLIGIGDIKNAKIGLIYLLTLGWTLGQVWDWGGIVAQ